MKTRWVELIRYRELIWNLVVKELKVRYKNSVFGFFWTLLNPLLMMVVLTVVFTVMIPATGIKQFPVFLLCGLLPWNFFTGSVMRGAHSIVNYADMIKKVYFPREVLPIAVVLSNFINFALALVVLFAMLFVFQIGLTRYALFLPVVIATQVIFVMGLALLLSTLNVFYRDVPMIMDVLLFAWFFLTPVFYPLEVLPSSYSLLGLTVDVQRWAYILNPMASIIASYRLILYGTFDGAPPAAPALDFFARTLATALAFLALGWAIFARYSKGFAEHV
jgi:lipopolysaccharide transport system permease protein